MNITMIMITNIKRNIEINNNDYDDDGGGGSSSSGSSSNVFTDLTFELSCYQECSLITGRNYDFILI
jgi:hypothetical protein